MDEKDLSPEVLAKYTLSNNAFTRAVKDNPKDRIKDLSPEVLAKYTLSNNAFTRAVKDNPKDKIEVEIGDSKQPDFKPQVKIQRWGNEVNTSIRLKDDGLEPETVTTDKDKIIWAKGTREVHFYDLPQDEKNPEGGYEFEVILKEKPKTNVIEFTLQDKDVDYFYQPLWLDPNSTMLSRISGLIQKKTFTSIADIGGGTGEFVKQFGGTCVDSSAEAYSLRQTDSYLRESIINGLSVGDKQYDLATGIGLLKYVGEESIAEFINEIVRISNRGIFFTGRGFRTFSDAPPIVNNHDRTWWLEQFSLYAPGYSVEIYDVANMDVPENVEGSYAVYAKIPKVNLSDGKEYKVGKVGHIFRPKIVDSVGTEVWGDLHIESGILSVTVPQEFLDKAVYPIRHAAGLTFGYETAGGTNLYLPGDADVYLGGLYSVGATGGAVDSLTFSCVHAGSPTSLKAVITNSSKQIITDGVGGVVAPDGSKAWKTASYSSKPTVVASTSYYLGVVDQSGFYGMGGQLFADATGTTLVDYSNSYTTPTNPTDGSSAGNYKISIYATYTASGGGTAVKDIIGQGFIPFSR